MLQHPLNLVGESAASCRNESADIFLIINELYNFFSVSTYCWKVMKDILDPLGLKVVKKLSETRWSARHNTVSALLDGYSYIKSALFQVADNLEQNLRQELLLKDF